MTDQQRYDALGASGSPFMQTPNLDALAAGGAQFSRYFVNAPVCVVSRCTLFTGRYPHAHRSRENHTLLEYGREMHLFRVLRQEGYALGYSGKNHLLEQPELQANFDYVNSDARDDAALQAWYRAYKADLAAAGKPEVWRAGTFHDFPDEATRTGRTAAGGIGFLRDRPKDRPFCLCVSFSDPHVPHLAPRRFEALYPEEEIELLPWREGELAEKANRFGIKWRAQKSDRADDAGKRHYLAVYRAMVSYVDEKVGELMAELRAQGEEENTLVVFTSDHGDFNFEHNLYKKDLVLLDSLLHVPLVLSWPGRLRPMRVDAMAEEVDVLPTLLELLGVDPPFGIQGRSLAPLLHGRSNAHKSAVFAEICPPWLYNRFETYEDFEAHWGSWEETPMNVPGDFNKSIRTATHRYTWYGTGEEELYDHRTDPHELKSLAGDPAYAGTLRELKMQLFEWVVRSEDPLDPLSIRQNQLRYSAWHGGEPLPGAKAGPYWLEERFTPNPVELWSPDKSPTS